MVSDLYAGPRCRNAPLIAVLALILAPVELSARINGQPDDAFHRGERISNAIATITGTAISPLLGVCVLGAYQYLATPEPARASLPFYAAPAFWITIAVLIGLVLVKDTVGSSVPWLKKPLDAVGVLIVNKAALLFAVIPVVWHETAGWRATSGPLAAWVPSFYTIWPNAPAAIAAHIPAALSVVIGMAVAFVVWLAGHALAGLALLSPIPFLDLFLKGIRVATFMIIAVLTAINAKAGLIFSLIVIGICLICFWWALRLAIFGTVFAWDLLRTILFRRRSDPGADREILAFTGYRLGGMRKRSFGALRLGADGGLEFVHRPLGIGFSTLVRFDHADNYEIGRGLFFSNVLEPTKNGRRYRFLFRLLPRYAGHEEEIRRILGLRAVRDLRVPSELRAAWNWLSGIVSPA
jgi:hypothetical protein